jgi:hypothetical protein
MKQTVKRRSPRKAERMRPCECCGYPISQRHHLLEIAEWEENDVTVQLCANCHEYYHLIHAVYIKKSKSKRIVDLMLRLNNAEKTQQMPLGKGYRNPYSGMMPRFCFLLTKAEHAKELRSALINEIVDHVRSTQELA